MDFRIFQTTEGGPNIFSSTISTHIFSDFLYPYPRTFLGVDCVLNFLYGFPERLMLLTTTGKTTLE
jgi:hypothetical protein